MILNHLNIGIRNLFRNKLYSVINIGGWRSDSLFA